jgi:hypothetical protein
VVAPDAVGTFVITSAVKVNGVAISAPPSFTLEVARSTDQTLADVIAALEGTTVSPPDHGHLQAAIALLRVAQVAGTDLLGLEARIRLGAEAAEKLGRIQSADVSAPRRTVAQLVAAWERAWHDRTAPLATATLTLRRSGAALELARFAGSGRGSPMSKGSGEKGPSVREATVTDLDLAGASSIRSTRRARSPAGRSRSSRHLLKGILVTDSPAENPGRRRG